VKCLQGHGVGIKILSSSKKRYFFREAFARTGSRDHDPLQLRGTGEKSILYIQEHFYNFI
jgi:hypothetical protein